MFEPVFARFRTHRLFQKEEKRMLKVQTSLTLCFGRLLKRERLLCVRVMELETI
jgi:hypothetical protein